MNTRLFVPVATLSTQDIIPIIKFRIQKNNQLEKIFNKENPNPEQNRNLGYLVTPRFHGLSRPFVLSFKNEGDRRWNGKNVLSKEEIKD